MQHIHTSDAPQANVRHSSPRAVCVLWLRSEVNQKHNRQHKLQYSCVKYDRINTGTSSRAEWQHTLPSPYSAKVNRPSSLLLFRYFSVTNNIKSSLNHALPQWNRVKCFAAVSASSVSLPRARPTPFVYLAISIRCVTLFLLIVHKCLCISFTHALKVFCSVLLAIDNDVS